MFLSFILLTRLILAIHGNPVNRYHSTGKSLCTRNVGLDRLTISHNELTIGK